jgi:aspartyl-tRNA(Asn)/glutamyl-tRNA(Gln) amidotransferase subunit A
LEKLGAKLEDVRLPWSLLELQKRAGDLITPESFQIHQAYLETAPGPFDPHVKARILAGKSVTAAAYDTARENWRQAKSSFGALMANIDALLLPATPVPALPLAEVDESFPVMSQYTRAFNYLEACGLALPTGGTPEGLPTGMQIIGKAFDEPKLLRIGWAYEQASPQNFKLPELATLGL